MSSISIWLKEYLKLKISPISSLKKIVAVSNWIANSSIDSWLIDRLSGLMWHPFLLPEKNFHYINYLQYALGYIRYLLIFPLPFDLIFSTFRYYLYPHNQDSYMASWHRWVYYMGALMYIPLFPFIQGRTQFLLSYVISEPSLNGLPLLATAILYVSIWAVLTYNYRKEGWQDETRTHA
jgi:hypothetical protein